VAQQLITASPDDIRRYARGALDKAGADDVTPVPLDLVEQAVGLHPHEDLYAAGEDLPPRIRKIVDKMRLGAKVLGGLAIPEKRVYLDTSLARPRRRFAHGHEIGHHALPWQEQAYYTDDRFTLDPATRDAMEAEANAFSAELLFGIDRFTRMADDHAPGIVVPLKLNESFAVSAHAALRRYVSTSRHHVALLALGRLQVGTNKGNALRVFPNQCVESASFAERYGPIADLAAGYLPLIEFPALGAIMTSPSTTIIEDGGEITLDTKRGRTAFKTESFTNGRLNFVVVFRRGLLSGRRMRLAA
jgi:hypothetical protein